MTNTVANHIRSLFYRRSDGDDFKFVQSVPTNEICLAGTPLSLQTSRYPISVLYFVRTHDRLASVENGHNGLATAESSSENENMVVQSSGPPRQLLLVGGRGAMCSCDITGQSAGTTQHPFRVALDVRQHMDTISSDDQYSCVPSFLSTRRLDVIFQIMVSDDFAYNLPDDGSIMYTYKIVNQV